MVNTQPCFAVAPLTTRALRDKGIAVTYPVPKPLVFGGHAKDAVSQPILDAVRDVEYVSLRTSPYEQACALHSTFVGVRANQQTFGARYRGFWGFGFVFVFGFVCVFVGVGCWEIVRRLE